MMGGATSFPAAKGLSAPPSARPPAPPEDGLFSELVVSGPRKPRSRRTLVNSLIVHAVVLGAIVAIPLLQPVELPQPTDYLKAFIYDPPPAAAAPLPKGSSLVRKTEPVKKVADKTEKVKEPEKKPDFVAPIEIPKELPKENRVAANEQLGSETGSDIGIPEGMEGGVEGGVAGGIVGGVVGGCVGCTGDGLPVTDYDQGPKILRQTQPKYPQDAFVKKVEGVVLVRILIDGDGRVVRAGTLRGPAIFHEAAIQCVRSWLFVPAMRRGRAVASEAEVNVTFRIF